MAGRGRGNAWNRGSGAIASTSSRNSSSSSVMDRKPGIESEKASEENKAKIDLQTLSSSEEEDDDINSDDIVGKVLQSYAQLGGAANELGRTQLFLEEAFQSGSATCLICISSVGKNEAIWNCALCYCFFHLPCLQRWAQESIRHQKMALEEHPQSPAPDITWSCPKCRHEYPEFEIPSKYLCFCGKRADPPPYSGWHVPHSCGETCGRELTPDCGHSCPLLCHPGPCPPCPRQLNVTCQCGKQPLKTLRCSAKVWSCGNPCGKVLPCNKSQLSIKDSAPIGRGRGKFLQHLNDAWEAKVGKDADLHLCSEICHSGECKPCPRKSLQPCRCGRESIMRPCSEADWQCEQVCGKRLKCDNHKCRLICHSAKGDCEPCPRSLDRLCSCGKSSFPGLPCVKGLTPEEEQLEAVPTCGDTCGKLLACGMHSCARRCHKDDCGACLQMRVQTCRCGQYTKELPCQKEYLCDTKCKRIRNCLRHPCSRKCCDGQCPPCDKMCSRMLSCGNHRCPAPCHRGPCFPCPIMVPYFCPCKSTSIKISCGMDRKLKFQAKKGRALNIKCKKPCKLPSQCQHEPKPHTCHHGECPPCQQICGKVGPCGHACSAKCHRNVWVKEEVEVKKPAGPWERPAAPKKVKKDLPCPPCSTKLDMCCFGGHERKLQPCHSASAYTCGRECGRVIACGLHTCTRPCHLIKRPSRDLELEPDLYGKNCETCNNPCQNPRPNGCIHACIRGKCHMGDCPPCKQNIKQKCHCGLSPAIFIECRKWVAALKKDSKAEKDSKEAVEKLLSCGNQCPKLLSCGHRCEITCHSGPCPADVIDGKSGGDKVQCTQKVRVTCPCGLLKQRRVCKDVHVPGSDAARKDPKSLVLLECNEECKQRKEEETKAREEAAERKRREEEKRNAEELEKFKLKQEGRRGKARRRREREDLEDDGNFLRRHWILISVILSIAAVGIAVFMSLETKSK